MSEATWFVDEAITAPQKERNSPGLKHKLSKQQEELEKALRARYLSVDMISGLELDDLIDPKISYAKWLRVIILRVLVYTSALNELKNSYTFGTTKLYAFLGFKNFEEFAKKRDLITLREDLLTILHDWEMDLHDRKEDSHFPQALSENLSALCQLACLDEVQAQILGFAILLHTEGVLQECAEMMGQSISAFSIPKIFAAILGLKVSVVEVALDDHSHLMRSGLLSLDHRGEGDLRSRVDLLNWTFAKCAVIKQHDVRDLLKAYIRPVSSSNLTIEDYGHIAQRVGILKTYLAHVISTQKSGVNILIYGGAGLGKSELAKLLAKEINCDLMEVVATNLSGNPVTPMRRIRSYRLAQSLLQQGNMMVLFDECEEVLSGEGIQTSDVDPSLAQKSWVNMMLEENTSPAIWICNSIEKFEESYIRRFDMVFEMPMPDEHKRRDMLMNLCGQDIDQKLITQIAKNKYTSPALVAKTAQVVKAIATTQSLDQRNDLALMLVNDKLTAQGVMKVQSVSMGAMDLDFEPSMVNSPVCLSSLCAGVHKTREARMLLYGPPGTGKTRFGKWLADSLAIPHMVIKPSDLLGSYVGESERQIAKAFAMATRENAVLQFDECDTFLMDRRQAKQNWESSITATMLLEMESYQGIFIASTNLMEGIDDAAMRRFDMSIKFDFMQADKAWEMFQLTCQKLGLSWQDPHIREQFSQVSYLTPGDFEQACRQARFLPLTSAQALIQALVSAVAVKKCAASSRQIGFLG